MNIHPWNSMIDGDYVLLDILYTAKEQKEREAERACEREVQECCYEEIRREVAQDYRFQHSKV